MPRFAVLSLTVFGALLAAAGDTSTSQFEPVNRISGIGVDRERMSEMLVEARSARMVESMTFSIMRDPRAVPGAQRVTSPGLQSIFRKAASRSGLPAGMVEAIAYLESWGDSQGGEPVGTARHHADFGSHGTEHGPEDRVRQTV